MSDVNAVSEAPPFLIRYGERSEALRNDRDASTDEIGRQDEVSRSTLEKSVLDIELTLNSIVDEGTSLSFQIDDDVSRMVVSVRVVGSDEIIRQFPPEEFMTVAKFIAAQNPDDISEDFLKGVLFDQYS